jgi:hypothetical protein
MVSLEHLQLLGMGPEPDGWLEHTKEILMEKFEINTIVGWIELATTSIDGLYLILQFESIGPFPDHQILSPQFGEGFGQNY